MNFRHHTATKPPPLPVEQQPKQTKIRPAITGGSKSGGASCKPKPKQVISANVLFLIVLGLIVLVYGLVVIAFYEHEGATTANNANKNVIPQNGPAEKQQRRVGEAAGNEKPKPPGGAGVDTTQYPYWKDLVVRLAGMTAADALKELTEKDPFGTRKFEQDLLEQETNLGRLLDAQEILNLFPCPSSRITLPDQRLMQKARDFRDNKPGTFLFFQHLRKAGGTHFCSLAKANLPQNNVAKYYCMPDMNWSGGKNAGYLHKYQNEELIRRMAEEKQRIAGNEWDWFDVDHHFELPAVFATSFRKPLDRALSQFRFECIEDRGCKIKDVHEWWNKRLDLYNGTYF